MTANVADLLCRIVGPRLTVVVDACHIHLIVGDATHDAELQALLLALYSGKESALRVVGERSAKCVTHVVAESSDAVQTGCVGFYGKLVLRIGTRSGAPTLTIYIYRGVDLVHGGAYLVHRLDVMDAHKVEAESVNVEFVYPVLDALYHKLAHQRTL